MLDRGNEAVSRAGNRLNIPPFSLVIAEGFAQGLRLLRKDGKLAYISSNAWLRADYAMLLRQYLRMKTAEVYAAFGLNDDEIRLIEEETKYNYGEW